LQFIKSASPANPISTEIQQITKSSGEIFWVE
jgi:hypothetical protein